MQMLKTIRAWICNIADVIDDAMQFRKEMLAKNRNYNFSE